MYEKPMQDTFSRFQRYYGWKIVTDLKIKMSATLSTKPEQREAGKSW